MMLGKKSEAKDDSWEVASSGCSEKEERILDKKNKRISGNSSAALSEFLPCSETLHMAPPQVVKERIFCRKK